MKQLKPFHGLPELLAHGRMNLGANDLYILLATKEPSQATDVYREDLPDELPTGGGYVAGGLPVETTRSKQVGGIYQLDGTGPTFTAKGGQIGPFRFAVVYNQTGGGLVGFADYQEDVTLADGDSMRIELTNPIVNLRLM